MPRLTAGPQLHLRLLRFYHFGRGGDFSSDQQHTEWLKTRSLLTRPERQARPDLSVMSDRRWLIWNRTGSTSAPGGTSVARTSTQGQRTG